MTETKVKTQSMLQAYAEEMELLMRENERLVMVTADLSVSCKITNLYERFPERCINVGIAEQNMVSVAAGLAREGFLPFAHTFSVFASMRSCEQLRTDLFYTGLNVKLVGTHSGISHSLSGSSHFAIEDMGIVRAMPQSYLVAPADALSTRRLLRQLVSLERPVYLRLDRNPLPVLYTDDLAAGQLVLGRAVELRQGKEVAFIATGAMVHIALAAADLLYSRTGLVATVVDVHTVKPLDEAMIERVAAGHSCLFTVEEHNITGGLGSAVAEVLAEKGIDVPLRRCGIKEIYPNGMPLPLLRQHVGLTAEQIAAAAEEFIARQTPGS